MKYTFSEKTCDAIVIFAWISVLAMITYTFYKFITMF